MSNWSRGNCSENFPENSGKSERHHNGIVQSPCTMYLLLGQWPFSGHYSKSKTFDKFLSAASTDTPEQLNTNHPFIRTPKRSLKMVDKTFDLSAQFLARTEVLRTGRSSLMMPLMKRRSRWRQVQSHCYWVAADAIESPSWFYQVLNALFAASARFLSNHLLLKETSSTQLLCKMAILLTFLVATTSNW